MFSLLLAAAAFALADPPTDAPSDPLPVVHVDHDNIIVDHSCSLLIPSGMVIDDADRNGVVQIAADGITVEFAEKSVLRGSPAINADDRLTGMGIRVCDRRNVTIKGARIEGFKVDILATRADGLTLDNCRVDRNFRQRLKSTPQTEDQSDWLWPHKNDDHEWRENYGAAVCIEQSSHVTVRALSVRNSQNGLILDRVTDSRIYDCDCSFLSGWGLAMWRSSGNIISRNAFDFCIRGYSHGVYNRGQDSAGILCFEQCSRNLFIENSATHSGDGFFGFAGREAIGEAPAPEEKWDYKGRGCNDNRLIGNDFSFAAAHGVEMTFSFRNVIRENRLVGNAICGIWGGYSQLTTVAGNTIEDNGAPGAREGGGINIEHGFRNSITGNRFARNSVAVSLWSNDNPGLLKTPWAQANHQGSNKNLIADNTFTNEAMSLRLRKSTDTIVRKNTFIQTPDKPDTDDGSIVSEVERNDERADSAPAPDPAGMLARPIGETHPVSARDRLAGREHVIMGPWGPWDGESPMMRLASCTSSRLVYEIFSDTGPITLDVIDAKGYLQTDLGTVQPDQPRTLTLSPRPGDSVLPFSLRVRTRGIDETIRGTLIQATWIATVFPFNADPRTGLEGWRAESRSTAAVTTPCDDLDWMRFGGRAPRDLPLFREFANKAPGKTNFGVIAHTRLTLPAGKWRFSTLSDDGVRVLVNDKPIIENWTHHAPERNEGTYDQPDAGAVDITLEYFQLDGYSTCELQIQPGP